MKKEYLSVGFADMVEFSRLPMALGWDKTVAVLRHTFSEIGDMIVKHNGRIHKYGGDAILFTHTDPKQAIQAAQEISHYRYHAEILIIRYCVTIATGQVIRTQLGHSTYLVEDILGEPVMRANWLLTDAQNSADGYVLCTETQKYQ